MWNFRFLKKYEMLTSVNNKRETLTHDWSDMLIGNISRLCPVDCDTMPLDWTPISIYDHLGLHSQMSSDNSASLLSY